MEITKDTQKALKAEIKAVCEKHGIENFKLYAIIDNGESDLCISVGHVVEPYMGIQLCGYIKDTILKMYPDIAQH